MVPLCKIKIIRKKRSIIGITIKPVKFIIKSITIGAQPLHIRMTSQLLVKKENE